MSSSSIEFIESKRKSRENSNSNGSFSSDVDREKINRRKSRINKVGSSSSISGEVEHRNKLERNFSNKSVADSDILSFDQGSKHDSVDPTSQKSESSLNIILKSKIMPISKSSSSYDEDSVPNIPTAFKKKPTGFQIPIPKKDEENDIGSSLELLSKDDSFYELVYNKENSNSQLKGKIAPQKSIGTEFNDLMKSPRNFGLKNKDKNKNSNRGSHSSEYSQGSFTEIVGIGPLSNLNSVSSNSIEDFGEGKMMYHEGQKEKIAQLLGSFSSFEEDISKSEDSIKSDSIDVSIIDVDEKKGINASYLGIPNGEEEIIQDDFISNSSKGNNKSNSKKSFSMSFESSEVNGSANVLMKDKAINRHHTNSLQEKKVAFEETSKSKVSGDCFSDIISNSSIRSKNNSSASSVQEQIHNRVIKSGFESDFIDVLSNIKEQKPNKHNQEESGSDFIDTFSINQEQKSNKTHQEESGSDFIDTFSINQEQKSNQTYKEESGSDFIDTFSINQEQKSNKTHQEESGSDFIDTFSINQEQKSNQTSKEESGSDFIDTFSINQEQKSNKTHQEESGSDFIDTFSINQEQKSNQTYKEESGSDFIDTFSINQEQKSNKTHQEESGSDFIDTFSIIQEQKSNQTSKEESGSDFIDTFSINQEQKSNKTHQEESGSDFIDTFSIIQEQKSNKTHQEESGSDFIDTFSINQEQKSNKTHQEESGSDFIDTFSIIQEQKSNKTHQEESGSDFIDTFSINQEQKSNKTHQEESGSDFIDTFSINQEQKSNKTHQEESGSDFIDTFSINQEQKSNKTPQVESGSDIIDTFSLIEVERQPDFRTGSFQQISIQISNEEYHNVNNIQKHPSKSASSSKMESKSKREILQSDSGEYFNTISTFNESHKLHNNISKQSSESLSFIQKSVSSEDIDEFLSTMNEKSEFVSENKPKRLIDKQLISSFSEGKNDENTPKNHDIRKKKKKTHKIEMNIPKNREPLNRSPLYEIDNNFLDFLSHQKLQLSNISKSIANSRQYRALKQSKESKFIYTTVDSPRR